MIVKPSSYGTVENNVLNKSKRVSILFRNDTINDYNSGDRKTTERQRRHYYIIIIHERRLPPSPNIRNRFGKPTTTFISNKQLFRGYASKRVDTHNKTGSWPLPPTNTTIGLAIASLSDGNAGPVYLEVGYFALWSSKDELDLAYTHGFDRRAVRWRAATRRVKGKRHRKRRKT